MDKKLTDPAIPAATTIGLLDLLYLVQGGADKSVTYALLKSMILSGGLGDVLAADANTGSVNILLTNQVGDRVLITGPGKEITSSNVTATQLSYLDATSSIQAQLNALQTGLTWKEACRIAIGTNVTKSGIQTLQSVLLAVNDRVLLYGQTNPIDNGIWLVKAGPWARPDDFNNGTQDKIPGSVVTVTEGTNSNVAFICNNNNPTVIGVDNITFSVFGGTTYIGTVNRISVSGNTIDIDANYVGQASITTLGIITTGTWQANAIKDQFIDSTIQALTDAANIAWNINNGSNASVTLGGNRALVITNAIAGKVYILKVKQDATGSRTLTLPANSKVVNGGAGAMLLSTAANAEDILSAYYDGTNFYWTYGVNFN